MLASSGYVDHMDANLCAACGSCADVCQFAAISMDDGFACIDAVTRMGCGVCMAHCPQEAIGLVREPAKGEPLEIQKLIAQAALSPSGSRCPIRGAAEERKHSPVQGVAKSEQVLCRL
jgi:ferredoxin